MQLNPGEVFPIVYQLNDPSDTGTYYVRAVIRNARTGATIETVNLTDDTGQRFSYPWTVIQDSSGLGLFITITVTVYTDSGYTAKAVNYGIVDTTHLIHERVNRSFGGGGGVSVDYKRIAKMIKDEVAKIKIKDSDFTPILTSLTKSEKNIISLVQSLEQDEALAHLKSEMSHAKEVLSKISAFKESIQAAHSDVKNLQSIVGELAIPSEKKIALMTKSALVADTQEMLRVILDAFENLKEAIVKLPVVVPVKEVGTIKEAEKTEQPKRAPRINLQDELKAMREQIDVYQG